MNVHIFALYIFLRYSRFFNFRENIYVVKITFIILHRNNSIKNAKINPREIADFQKCAKIIHAKISMFTVCICVCRCLCMSVV